MTVIKVPRRLVEIGLIEGKQFKIVRKIGKLYQLNVDNINIIICENILKRIEYKV